MHAGAFHLQTCSNREAEHFHMSGEPRCPLGAITGRQPTDTSLLQPASKAKCSAAAETDRGRPKSVAPFEVCCDCHVAHAVDAPALAIRPPCDRPRCRARRLALRLARREIILDLCQLISHMKCTVRTA